MSRRKPRKPKPTRRVQVPIKRLDAIVEQTRSAPLGEDDHATLKAAVDTLARLTEELETKTTTLERVRRLIFGPSSERTDTVVGKDRPEGDAPPDQAARYARIIHDETIRLTRLLDDLLDLGVLEGGRVQLNIELANLRDILDRAMMAAGSTRPERDFVVDRDPAGAAPVG